MLEISATLRFWRSPANSQDQGIKWRPLSGNEIVMIVPKAGGNGNTAAAALLPDYLFELPVALSPWHGMR